MKVLLPLAATFLLCGCVRTSNTNNIGFSENMQAYVPVYADLENISPVAIQEARSTTNAGKIYVYRKYIFQNEENQGIHIIDNTDPAHPVKKAFLSIPYNTEMAVRSNYIYANSVNDLIVINMTNPLQPTVVNTLKNAFPLQFQDYPPASGYFVCPDREKGIVVSWKLENVKTATCRR